MAWFDFADAGLHGLSEGAVIEFEVRPAPTVLCESPHGARGLAFGDISAGLEKGGRRMRLRVQDQVQKGCRISYHDSRPGHQDVRATVLGVVEGHGILVQFDDRADTTYILFADQRWIDHLSVVA